jgi:Holliday junction resolvasome RuvABC endonuclease subunit
MTIANRIKKVKANSVIGVDASTTSLAFAVLVENNIEYGKIYFDGDTIIEKLMSARSAAENLADDYDIDFVAVEASVMVRSVSVAIKLAYFDSVILAELMREANGGVLVSPIEWQNFIGNANLTKAEKSAMKRKLPGKSASWYRSEVRTRRKQYTIDYVNNLFKIEVDDNDIADAIAIAHWAENKMIRTV